jgi:hypothetical protein
VHAAPHLQRVIDGGFWNLFHLCDDDLGSNRFAPLFERFVDVISLGWRFC